MSNNSPRLTPEQLRSMEEQLRQRLTPEQIAMMRQQMMNNHSQQQQQQQRPSLKSLMHTPPHMVLAPLLITQLADKLYPNVTDKMDEKFRYKSKDELKQRIRKVLFIGNKNVFWLTSKMIHGLMHYDDEVEKPLDVICQPPVANGQVAPGRTCLGWNSQWRSLEKQVGWAGKDDIVALLIAAGADVNGGSHEDSFKDTTLTPIFHASNFGTVDTLRMFVEAGADVYGSERGLKVSILKTMMARPDPEKVAYILDKDPDAAKDTYDLSDTTGKTRFLSSPADILLNSWFSDLPIMSWKILGAPSAEDCFRVFVQLTEAGCKITSNVVSIHFLSKYMNAIASPQLMGPEKAGAVQLAKALIGTWLPSDMKTQVLGYKSSLESPKDCSICNIIDDETRKKITLSCGHTFHISCIKDYAEENVRCPVRTCRKRLCRELNPSPQDFNPEDPSAHYGGPENLTDDQIRTECAASGIEFDHGSRSSLAKSRVPSKEKGLFVECSAAGAVGKVGAKVSWMTPKRGPVWIPITVKSIPILASVSTSSSYTLVSSDFIQTFALRKSRLVSKSMKSFLSSQTNRQTFTVIDDFNLMVGDVCVKINNAVEINPAPCHLGIQLGQDFFQYAAFSKLNLLCNLNVPANTYDGSTPVNKDFIAVTEGGFRVGYTTELKKREELRYYGWCGKSARVPVYHANHSGTALPLSALKTGSHIKMCHWCNREFSGMMRCPPCAKVGKDVNYCDDKCQRKAWKIHKTKPPHAN